MKKLLLCIPLKVICKVEISKDQPHEKSKGYLFRAHSSVGVNHITCIALKTQRQAEE